MSERPSFQELDLLKSDELRRHEEILSERISDVKEQIEREEIVDYPILVDRDYYVILDGHHRYSALIEHGVSTIPVVKIDYFRDGLVKLEARKNCPLETLSKQDVLRKGLSSDVFPPKSTRHTLREPLVAENVPLEDLR